MAVTLNANTSTGFIATSDTSGVLQLQTAGTTAVTVDASQNVGIGTTSPTSYAGYASLALNNATNGGVYDILKNDTRVASFFSSDVTTTLASITSIPLVFRTANTERMRVNAGAPILCLSGGSTTATGTGIAFPATQSASSDVNTLDDYEEGTFTPNQGAGLTVVGTFSSSGTYTKVGRLVTVIGLVTGSTSVASSSGGAICSNLPFTSASGTVGGVADSNGGGGSCLISTTSALSYPAHTASPGIYFTATYAV